MHCLLPLLFNLSIDDCGKKAFAARLLLRGPVSLAIGEAFKAITIVRFFGLAMSFSFGIMHYLVPKESLAMLKNALNVLFKYVHSEIKSSQQSNAQNAVLFETLNLAIHMEFISGNDSALITDLAFRSQLISLLGRLIHIKHANLRSAVIDAMAQFAKVLISENPANLSLLHVHLDSVFDALEAKDFTVRYHAILLAYTLADDTCASKIITAFMNLLAFSPSPTFYARLVMCIMKLLERFGSKKLWYVDIVLQLLSIRLTLSGPDADSNRAAVSNVQRIAWEAAACHIIATEDLQKYAIKKAFLHISTLDCQFLPGGAMCFCSFIVGKLISLLSERSVEIMNALGRCLAHNWDAITKHVLLESIFYVACFGSDACQSIALDLFGQCYLADSPLAYQMVGEYYSILMLPEEERKSIVAGLDTFLIKNVIKGTEIDSTDILPSPRQTLSFKILGKHTRKMSTGSNRKAGITKGNSEYDLLSNLDDLKNESSLYGLVEKSLWIPSGILATTPIGQILFTISVSDHSCIMEVSLCSKMMVIVTIHEIIIPASDDGLEVHATRPLNEGIALESGERMTLDLEFICKKEFMAHPILVMSCKVNDKLTNANLGNHKFHIELPVAISRFFKSIRMDESEFVCRWNQIGNRDDMEQQCTGEFRKVQCAEDLKTIIDGCQLTALEDIDPCPDNFIFAAIIQFQVSGNVGFLMRLEPNFEKRVYAFIVVIEVLCGVGVSANYSINSAVAG